MSLQKLQKLQKLMSNKRLSPSERQSIIGKINKMENDLELQCHGSTEETVKDNKVLNIIKQKEEKQKRIQMEEKLKKEAIEKQTQKEKDREYAEIHRAQSQKIFQELLAKKDSVFRISFSDEIADDWDSME